MMDARYFINKFEAIPEEKWTSWMQINSLEQRCALGHLMPENLTYQQVIDSKEDLGFGHKTEEGKAIGQLFMDFANRYKLQLMNPEFPGQLAVAKINNGESFQYQQDTPKQRILAALMDIEAKEQNEVNLATEAALKEAEEIISVPLCDECGRPVTKCVCSDSEIYSEEEEEEDWGAGAAEEISSRSLVSV